MAEPALFATSVCPTCRERKPLAEFSPCSCYCRPCKNAYDSARMRAKRAGTWGPDRRGTYVRQPLPEPILETPRPLLVPGPGDDDALRSAIHDYFRTYGFTRLRSTTEKLITDLARNRRVDLAREGWIA